MSVFAPAPAERKTCRGKAGKSQPHPHYEGDFHISAKGGLMVTRCSSCRKVCAWDAYGEGKRLGYQPVADEDLAALGLAIIANLR